MSKLKALVLLNLRAMLNALRFTSGGKKGRRATGVGAAVLLGFIGLYLSGTYSFLLASQLAPVGMTHLVLLMMPVMVVGMGLLFTVFAAQGVIFGGKDNDIMLALPIPAFTLLLARTLALYLENLVFAVFVMLPAGVAYLVYGGGGGLGFFLRLLLCIFFLALLPTTLDLLVGFALAWASGRFARRALLTNLLYAGAFILLLVFIIYFNLNIQNLTAAVATGIERGFSAWGVPFILFMQATAQGNALSLLIFIALCTLPFLLVVWLFAGRYQRIVTSLGVSSSRSDYKLGKIKALGAPWALIAKEAKRFFTSPIYFFNAGFGLVFMVVGGVGVLIFREKIGGYLAQVEGLGTQLPLMPLVAATLAFLVSMTAITGSSISLEGKRLWILKEAPLSAGQIFTAKVGFHLMAELPCLLISSLCLTAAFALSMGDWLVIFLVNAAIAVFCALFGLLINLCLPKLDADSDAAVVKQSAAAIVNSLVPMILALALGGLWIILRGKMGDAGAMLMCTLILAMGCGVLAALLNTLGKKIWRTL